MVFVNKALYDKADIGRRILEETSVFSQDKALREKVITHMMELGTYSADLNGIISGFASIRQTAPTAFEIAVMAVLPSAQRQGVGRALLGKIEDNLREAGARFLIAKIPSEEGFGGHFSAARDFFRQNGFSVIDIVKGSLFGEMPSLFMIKTVAEASNAGEYTWY